MQLNKTLLFFKDDYVQAWHHLVILVESSLPNTSLIPIKEVKRRNSSQSRNVNMLTDACSSNQLLKVLTMIIFFFLLWIYYISFFFFEKC